MCITNEFDSYALTDTVASELHNNLVLVNVIVASKNLKAKPQFFILGGAAMVFHALNYSATLDIDTANKVEESIREDVSMFIDDNASEVTSLGKHYKKRAIRYGETVFSSIEVYLLSYEDLLLTKLFSARRKDLTSVKQSGILHKIEKETISSILNTEYSEADASKIRNTAKMFGL